MDVTAYAESVGRPGGSIQHEIEAARVAEKSPGAFELAGYFKHLVAIHVAPEWRGRSPAAVSRRASLQKSRWTSRAMR
jgi:hypothetical protein